VIYVLGTLFDWKPMERRPDIFNVWPKKAYAESSVIAIPVL
jgi:hypothetical protein